jgi:hypothetical protein
LVSYLENFKTFVRQMGRGSKDTTRGLLVHQSIEARLAERSKQLGEARKSLLLAELRETEESLAK